MHPLISGSPAVGVFQADKYSVGCLCGGDCRTERYRDTVLHREERSAGCDRLQLSVCYCMTSACISLPQYSIYGTNIYLHAQPWDSYTT